MVGTVMRAMITAKGQITIPVAVRTDLNVGPGDRIEFVKLSDGNYEVLAARQDITELKGLVKAEEAVSIEAMNQAIRNKAEAL